MSERELVIQALTARMMAAFTKGDLIDAQNLEAFICTLERSTDSAYASMAAEPEYSDVA